jgi:dolichyl-phosphate-mannose--protein O-mannosyl transferase
LVPVGVFAILVAAALVDHYFRDEFYYLACSHRLAWGYVDHPPLSIAVLWVVRHIAGESLLTLRVTAALASALTVWLAGSIARRLGASAFGETLAMTGTAVAPELLPSAASIR